MDNRGLTNDWRSKTIATVLYDTGRSYLYSQAPPSNHFHNGTQAHGNLTRARTTREFDLIEDRFTDQILARSCYSVPGSTGCRVELRCLKPAQKCYSVTSP